MLFIFIITFVLVLDRVTKYYVMVNMIPGQSEPIIEGIFRMTFVRNAGAAFGILQNQLFFFVVITVPLIFILLAIYWRYARNKNLLLTAALSLQIGGAFGNLIDRVNYGYVIDFLDFKIWPVFNIADIAIVVGALLIAYYLLFNNPQLRSDK